MKKYTMECDNGEIYTWEVESISKLIKYRYITKFGEFYLLDNLDDYNKTAYITGETLTYELCEKLNNYLLEENELKVFFTEILNRYVKFVPWHFNKVTKSIKGAYIDDDIDYPEHWQTKHILLDMHKEEFTKEQLRSLKNILGIR